MSYTAKYNANITARKGVSKKAAEDKIEQIFNDIFYSERSSNGTHFEISGKCNYSEEDISTLALFFDGYISFTGEECSNWDMFFENGSAKITHPIEIIKMPGESTAQTLARYISREEINVVDVLKALPNYICGKLWFEDDIVTKMNEMGINEKVQEVLLPLAKERINKDFLEEYTEEDWNTIKSGIDNALYSRY